MKSVTSKLSAQTWLLVCNQVSNLVSGHIRSQVKNQVAAGPSDPIRVQIIYQLWGTDEKRLQ